MLKISVDISKDLCVSGDDMVDTGLDRVPFKLLHFFRQCSRLDDNVDVRPAMAQTEPKRIAAFLLAGIVLVCRRPKK